jgi:hypothetical protein
MSDKFGFWDVNLYGIKNANYKITFLHFPENDLNDLKRGNGN